MTFIKKLGPIQKRMLLVLTVALVIGSGIGVYKFLNKSNTPTIDTESKTTSNVESAQSGFTSGGPRQPSNQHNPSNVAVSDTSGSAKPPVDSTPIRSSDGTITVYSPGSNSFFKSGDSLVGSAGTSRVSYRLADSVSGVIATGELTVVNGSFSGRFNFSTSASEGRLDVFVVGDGGIEKSIVEIPVRLK